MKTRILSTALIAIALGACYASDSEEIATEIDAAPEMSVDEQALVEMAAYWATHYNMGHPGMVASVYSPDAWFLAADGGAANGPEEIEALLARNAAMSPQIEITPDEWMIFGDQAVGWGAYSITMTPVEGAEPVTWGGSYMTRNVKIDGEWKIAGHIGNLTDDPFEGFAYTQMSEPPADEGTMTDVVEGIVTHFNMGHPDMVADYYAEDAMVAFSRGGPVHGRAAVAEQLARVLEGGPQMELHDVGTVELADGWATDGGWYQLMHADSGEPYQTGAYYNLMRRAEDGSWQVYWGITNSVPVQGDGM